MRGSRCGPRQIIMHDFIKFTHCGRTVTDGDRTAASSPGRRLFLASLLACPTISFLARPHHHLGKTGFSGEKTTEHASPQWPASQSQKKFRQKNVIQKSHKICLQKQLYLFLVPFNHLQRTHYTLRTHTVTHTYTLTHNHTTYAHTHTHTHTL